MVYLTDHQAAVAANQVLLSADMFKAGSLQAGTKLRLRRGLAGRALANKNTDSSHQPEQRSGGEPLGADH